MWFLFSWLRGFRWSSASEYAKVPRWVAQASAQMMRAGTQVRQAASFWGLAAGSVLLILVFVEGRCASRAGTGPVEELDERSRSMKDTGFPGD